MPLRKTADSRRPAAAARFVETMDCLPVPKIPSGEEWSYEVKLDGYRLEAVKSRGRVTVFSRRRNVLNEKFGYIAEALADLPDGTVIGGELVALDPDGRSNFNLLQNFRSAEAHIHYYAFDVLTHRGKDLTCATLAQERGVFRG
jgi:bifunctional non-homologous end joining protein LigD